MNNLFLDSKNKAKRKVIAGLCKDLLERKNNITQFNVEMLSANLVPFVPRVLGVFGKKVVTEQPAYIKVTILLEANVKDSQGRVL